MICEGRLHPIAKIPDILHGTQTHAGKPHIAQYTDSPTQNQEPNTSGLAVVSYVFYREYFTPSLALILKLVDIGFLVLFFFFFLIQPSFNPIFLGGKSVFSEISY